MAVDFSKYDLNKPDEFAAASVEVAEGLSEALGDDYARVEGENVFINTKVISAFTTTATVNSLKLMITGDIETATEMLKLVTAINAALDEAKFKVKADTV